MTDTEPSPQSAVGTTWQKQIDGSGAFRRRPTTFRDWIGTTAESRFTPEAGRYHLYISYACPWAHRTLILRRMKGLEQAISYDVVDWFLDSRGWTLKARTDGATRDSLNGKERLRDVYRLASPGYGGSVTVPVLWDRKLGTIVNNESAEIIEMFNGAFQSIAKRPELDLYPETLRPEIDSINDWVYELLNDGVYRSGFARTQAAYEEAARGVFEALERAEALLAERRYIAGKRLTLADIRLWTTLVRFDLVYVTHFKCNWKRLVDYPNLWAYTRELYAMDAIRPTVNFEHIKRHYFESHESVNPHRIVPIGPTLDFDAPHDRERLARD